MDREIGNKTVNEDGISKFTVERLESAHERENGRLWIIIIILLGMLTAAIVGGFVAVNAVNDKWAKILSEYELESYEVDLSSDGDSDAVYNYIGKDGDIYNGGTGDSEKNNLPEESR